jgi:tetratricopeptide (TPR) repeat protein
MALLDDEQDPNQEGNEPAGDDELWDDLLGNIEYEEPPEEPPSSSSVIERLLDRFRGPSKPAAEGSKSGGFFRRLTRTQKLILGTLGVLILLVYVGIGVMVLRSLPASTASPLPPAGGITVVTAGTPVKGSAGTPIAQSTPTRTPTREGYAEEPTPLPTATPPPNATPTPQPVFTQYDQQVQANPTDLELRLKRAEAYMELGAYAAALADYEQARKLDEERAEVYVGIGQANYYLRRWTAAQNAFGTAIAFNQDLPEAHFGLGRIHYFQGKYEEAAKAFDWAAEINPDFARAEAWLAIAAARAGDVEEALGASERALAVDPELPLAYVARSWARRVQDPPDLEAAQADLLYAQDLAPYNFEVLNALARFYQEHRPERLAEAEQLAQYALNWAEEDLERARALHTLGRIYLEQGRVEEAQRTLAEAADSATSEGRIVLAGLVKDLERALEQ